MKNKFVILIFLLAIISGLFWGWGDFHTAPEPGGDGPYYNEIALNFLNDHQLSYQGESINIAPGYPVFISTVYFFFGQNNYFAVRIAQIILFAVLTIIFYYLAQRIFGKKTAMLTGLLMSVFYVFPIAANRFNREILTIFVLSLALLFLYKAFFSKKTKHFFVAGLFWGLLILVNSITQFLFVLLAILFFIIARKNFGFKKVLLNIFIFLLAVACVFIPWVLISKSANDNNALAPRDGKLLYNRADIMEKLYPDYPAYLLGHSFGYYFVEKLYPEIDIRAYRDSANVMNRIEELENDGYTLVESNQILREEAIDKIISQPHKYVLMATLDFINFNNPVLPSKGEVWINSRTHMLFTEGRHAELNSFVKSSIVLAIRLFVLLFFVFIFYALFRSPRKWYNISFLLLVILYFNLTYSVIHAIPRYAMPIYPLYIMLFSSGLLIFIEKSTKMKRVSSFISSKISQLWTKKA